MVDIVHFCIYLLIAGAVGTTVWAVVRSARLRDKSAAMHHHVPARRIALAVAAFLVVCLLVTFLFGSTEPLLSNGKPFTSAGWLRTTDMLINTSIVLVIVAAACMAAGRFKC